MAGFSTVDDLINASTNLNQRLKIPFSRIPQVGATSAAGRFHECFTTTGSGTNGALALTGTGALQIPTSSTAGVMNTGPAVAPKRKYVQAMSVWSGATTLVPAVVVLTDLIGYYAGIDLAASTTSLSGTTTWGTADSRLENAIGIQASIFFTTAGTTTAGQWAFTYADQDGNSQAQPGYMWSVATTGIVGSALASSNASGFGGPFVPLASGDSGIKYMNSYARTAGTTAGVGVIMLHRPICTIPIPAANVIVEKDFISMGIFNRVYDDSCLGLMVQIGGSLVATGIANYIAGEIDIVWA